MAEPCDIETRSDPWQSPDGVARKLVADTLTQINDNGEVLPGLAMRWESQSANHRWQFHLRNGVRFHDGSPLTAEAVVQSLSQAVATAGGGRAQLASRSSSPVNRPCPALPAELARSMYAIPRKDEAGNLDGTGPFRLRPTPTALFSSPRMTIPGTAGHSSTPSKSMATAQST